MFGIVEPYSGHFFEAEYLEYDSENKDYLRPILIRVKGQSEIGVTTGIKETTYVNENGRWVNKEVFKIHVVTSKKYKPKDKIRFLQTDTTYIVHKVGDDINHVNSMATLMFPKLDNRPKILYLGD